MLQAMGLGGWMYNGLDRNTILGASGDARDSDMIKIRDGHYLIQLACLEFLKDTVPLITKI